MIRNKETKRATVHFSCDGKYISMLDVEITFTTIAGAKRALIRVINKNILNLQMYYGYGKRVNVEAVIVGMDEPFMTTSINI